MTVYSFFFFQAEDGIRDLTVTGVQTCALPISCTPPGCGVPPTARCPETRTAAHLGSQTRAATARAGRARCSGSRLSRFCAKLLRDRRCPSPLSGSHQLSGSPTGDQEFRGRLQCVRGRQADLEKLRPKDFPIPCAAMGRRFWRRRENAAPLETGSRSNATEW